MKHLRTATNKRLPLDTPVDSQSQTFFIFDSQMKMTCQKPTKGKGAYGTHAHVEKEPEKTHHGWVTLSRASGLRFFLLAGTPGGAGRDSLASSNF